MGWVTCEGCGNSVSQATSECPICGRPKIAVLDPPFAPNVPGYAFLLSLTLGLLVPIIFIWFLVYFGSGRWVELLIPTMSISVMAAIFGYLWPSVSWKWGLFFWFPFIAFIIYLIVNAPLAHMSIVPFLIYFVLIIPSCISALIGAKLSNRKLAETR
jgi:hypothetical protein